MNCPKCGKELLEGHLYCENCGGEINLVPEFETEIEKSMAESMQGIIENVAPEVEARVERKPKKSSKIFFIVGGFAVILVFFLAAISSGGITVWKNSTFIQEMFVEYYLDDGDFETAIDYMESVIEKAPENVNYRFKMGEIYMQQGNADKALEIYKTVAGSPQYTVDEQIAATEYIIDYYTAMGKYEEIAEYLITVQDENIKMAFMEYMSGTVTFSQPEGTYATMITLKLSSDGIGKIYYTTDGTKPDKNSLIYQNTIFLEPGDNVVSAVFINDYGVSSPVVTKNYHIESKKVSPPEVLTYSGTYTCPVKMQVAASEESTVYYTTDGSTPTRKSTRYTGEFYLPLGKSVYKFIAVGYNGEASEVVTRNIQITLDTEMTTSDAENLLVQYHVENFGAVSDGAGHIVQDDTHILIYEYLYPMTVEVGVDCYYFAEVSRDTTTQEQHRTNRYFGVDVRSGDIYTFN